MLFHLFTYSLSDKISILFSIYKIPESFIGKQQIQDINYERYRASYALITSRDRTVKSRAWLWRQKDNMKKLWDWVNYLITFVWVALSVRLGCIDRKHTSLFKKKKNHNHGQYKHISCPKLNYTKFIFYSRMGQKIYLWLVPLKRKENIKESTLHVDIWRCGSFEIKLLWHSSLQVEPMFPLFNVGSMMTSSMEYTMGCSGSSRN